MDVDKNHQWELSPNIHHEALKSAHSSKNCEDLRICDKKKIKKKTKRPKHILEAIGSYNLFSSCVHTKALHSNQENWKECLEKFKRVLNKFHQLLWLYPILDTSKIRMRSRAASRNIWMLALENSGGAASACRHWCSGVELAWVQKYRLCDFCLQMAWASRWTVGHAENHMSTPQVIVVNHIVS